MPAGESELRHAAYQDLRVGFRVQGRLGFRGLGFRVPGLEGLGRCEGHSRDVGLGVSFQSLWLEGVKVSVFRVSEAPL